MTNKRDKKFSSESFLKKLGIQVVQNLENASLATTPSLKGEVRESEIRKQLEKVLPGGVGVGTGCVIDSYGSVSSQQDIILYEKDICPKFYFPNSPSFSYYPCEGVIAVGEIKTALGKKELVDSFSKIRSVKELKRFAVVDSNLFTGECINAIRKYLSRISLVGTQEQSFNQDKATDQIYGFVICKNFSIKPKTVAIHISKLTKEHKINTLPNILVSLEDGVFRPFNRINDTLVLSGKEYVFGINKSGCFSYLLSSLYTFISAGRTVDQKSFERYILTDRSLELIT